MWPCGTRAPICSPSCAPRTGPRVCVPSPTAVPPSFTEGDPPMANPDLIAVSTPTADPRLARMLDPRSIAVLGASTDPRKRGDQAVRALLAAGYRYPLHPVNPRGGSILGLPVARTIA